MSCASLNRNPEFAFGNPEFAFGNPEFAFGNPEFALYSIQIPVFRIDERQLPPTSTSANLNIGKSFYVSRPDILNCAN